MKKKYVRLEYPNGLSLEIDSLENAIESIDKLGLCMNWAIISPMGMKEKMTIITYQGWTYQRTPERFVKLPFDQDTDNLNFAKLFKKLLQSILFPFLGSTGDIYRSSITVTLHPKESNCFYVDMTLIFWGKGKAEIIQNTLKKVADSSKDVKSKFFGLD